MTVKSPGLAVGHNLRRVRQAAGDTQGDCARKAGEYGLQWTHSHVSAFENNRRTSVTIEELLVLSSIYNVGLAEWFAGDSTVEVTSGFVMPEAEIADVLNGKWTSSRRVLDFSEIKDYSADERIAQRLKMTQDQVSKIATDLWGHHATAERDKRLSGHGDKTPSEMRTLRAGMTKHLAHQIKLHVEGSGE